jgi:hypothetical protein
MSISNQTGSTGFPVPVGTIIAFAGQVIPPKYLLCNGDAFSGVTYPILASLLGGTNTPNLVGGIIGGGTTRTVVPGGQIIPNNASFNLEVENIPAFTTTVASSSFSGYLNATAQTKSSTIQTLYTDSVHISPALVSASSYSDNVGVALASFTGELVAQAGTAVGGIVTIANATPATLSIQYLVKAGY